LSSHREEVVALPQHAMLDQSNFLLHGNKSQEGKVLLTSVNL